MATKFDNITLKAMSFNGAPVKKWVHEGVEVFSAGSTVTYYISANRSYTEEVEIGSSCLSPKTFTPTQDGWTFVGWREDTTASSDVLTSKTMTGDPIVLYAVFKRTLTAKFVSYNLIQNVSGEQYYNNGHATSVQVTAPTGATYSGWTWRGWSDIGNTAADSGVGVSVGGSLTIWGDVTLYGLYRREVVLTYDGNGATGGSTAAETKYSYYSASSATKHPEFTLKANGFIRANYAFNGWDLGAVGAKVTISESKTAKAQWVGTAFTISSTGTYKFTDYTWTNSKPNGSAGSYDQYVNTEKIYLSAEKTGGNDACNQYTGSIDTRGCKKLRVKYACYGGTGYICGVACESADLASPKYLYIDISGNPYTFTAQIWSRSADPSSKSLHILEIYVHDA